MPPRPHLARALRRLGHTTRIVPLHLPPSARAEACAPLFFGANSRLPPRPRFPAHPASARRRDRPPLAAPPGRRPAHGAAASPDPLDMLRGAEGPHAREFRRFAAWLARQLQPDAILLSGCLLAAFAPVIRRAVKTRVFCTVQGELATVRDLAPETAAQVWKAVSAAAPEVDGWIAVSEACRAGFLENTRVPADRVFRVWSGIDMDAFEPAPAPPETPVLGFLGRLCAAKGLGKVVAAFTELKRDLFFREVRLRLIGAATSADRPYIAGLRKQLQAAGLDAEVEWHPNVDDDSKAFLLRGCTLLSVPPGQPEAFGLFIPEALASGVPLVLPRCGSFPELVAATGGGILYEPDDVPGLTAAWREVLARPEALAEAARRGRESAPRLFRADRMAREIAALLYAASAR
ncbi:MAG: glycosyltransferase family 4 protein [Kiritimatiellia bacterium]